MGRTIQVFEHERLTLKPDRWGQSLTIFELQNLYSFNDRNHNKYFTGTRDGIKFTSYVGVIQIGGLTLEILPKADKHTERTLAEHSVSTKTWHNALLRMLAVCNHIRVESVSEASLERRNHSILDLYFELLLDEVETLLHQGLCKKYRANEGNLSVLKGRLCFNRNISQNLIHQERFYTHHQVYDQDHLLNQILLRALVILAQISSSPFIKDRLARVKLHFPEIEHIIIQGHHFDKLTENRKTVHYREAVKIARMIILNYSPDIKGGKEDMLALLFDMNKLWEEYVYRLLVGNNPDNHKVQFQNSQHFWRTKTYTKTIRPDLVISKGNGNTQEIFVIDTKWKVIDSSKPDDSDLKQIFAYNLYWKSYHSILLYPSTTIGTSNVPGVYPKGSDQKHGCTLAFVDVLDQQGNLNKACSEQLWGFINNPELHD
jgi:5-methylcytosine-specific restriction enzyme subunit McrC